MMMADVLPAEGRTRPSIGGIIVVILGAYVLASGIWVIGFGGPWGNAVTGLGMVGGGAVNARGEKLGGWVHAVVWFGTLVWALA